MILRWIEENKPGEAEQHGSELRVTHRDGDVSSLWLRPQSVEIPKQLEHVREVYERFDGADLFSSAFKIAAIREPKTRSGVTIVPSLAELMAETLAGGCHFPEEATPFMIQTGIGLYAVALSRRVIYEWDDVAMEVSGEYSEVGEILEEWQLAVG